MHGKVQPGEKFKMHLIMAFKMVSCCSSIQNSSALCTKCYKPSCKKTFSLSSMDFLLIPSREGIHHTSFPMSPPVKAKLHCKIFNVGFMFYIVIYYKYVLFVKLNFCFFYVRYKLFTFFISSNLFSNCCFSLSFS